MSWNEQRPRDPQQQHGFDLIGATVERRRVSLGWTQRKLEAVSGIDQTNISRIENGKQYGLRWSRFADLVDALGGLDVGPQPAPAYRDVPAALDRIDLDAGTDEPDEPDEPDERGRPGRTRPTRRAGMKATTRSGAAVRIV